MALQSRDIMSINNILNPEPSPPASQPELSSTYWPVLRDALLRDPSSYDNLHLECGMCLDKMTVFQHEHTYDAEMSNFSHRARILPCGHMFGSKCALMLIDLQVANDLPISCPTCRVVFPLHRDCLHSHFSMPMPTSIDEIRTFPPTLSEGGVVAEKCGDCQAAEIIIGVNYLAPMFLFPFELPDGDAIVVSARTTGQVWDLRRTESVGEYCTQELSIKGPLKMIFDEIQARLKRNLTRCWCSADLRSFELCISLCQQW